MSLKIHEMSVIGLFVEKAWLTASDQPRELHKKTFPHWPKRSDELLNGNIRVSGTIQGIALNNCLG